jgi:hypothetical protein
MSDLKTGPELAPWWAKVIACVLLAYLWIRPTGLKWLARNKVTYKKDES